MTVKRKIILVLALPICGLAAFVLFSFFQMRGVSAGMRTASGDTFLPILKNDIPEMNRLSAGISFLLNADRDAYQAFLAETVAATTENSKDLQKADRDNQENITQVQQRLGQASPAFNSQMKPFYDEFRKNFQVWEKHSRKVVSLAHSALEQHTLILSSSVEGENLFAQMRETINKICDMMEKNMNDTSRSFTASQAERVHVALALLLNADRDAYQAFLAQTQIPMADTEEKIAALDKDNADNLRQIEDRVSKASDVFDAGTKVKYNEFRDLFAQWKVKTRQIVKAATAEFQLRQQQQKAIAFAAVSFDAMRDNIDKLGNVMEERIKVLSENMNRQGVQATGALDVMAGSMSSAIIMFVVIGLVLIILPLVLGLLCVRSIVKPLERAVGVADAVSRGDFSQRMNLNSNDELGMLGRAIDRVPETLAKIDLQFDKLSRASEEGDLSFRGDAVGLDGAYRGIIEIVNKTLDNISHPVNESLRVLDGLKVNDLSNAIDIRGFKGDYLRIATAVNYVRARLLDLQRTIVSISAGNLSDLPAYEKVGRRSGQDQLTPAIISMMQSLNRLIEDIEMMATAGVQGNLDAKAEESVHEGAFRSIIASVNKLMSAVCVPLREVGNVMEHVSSGDLTRRVSGHYEGEFSQLKDHVNNSVDSIDSAIKQVSEAVSQVNAGSVQIADASQSLSQGATEQAASLEEISSSLNEIGSQVNGNAVNAGKSNELSTNARTNAKRGYEEMKLMVAAMQDINESSQEIAKIIKIIDEIAFQTNLLALNAAVEAARAGIHGKGFAVVAEEVRNLAGRSAKAAHETAEMIDSSLSRVEKGLSIVDNSAQSFELIVQNIAEVSDIGGSIAEACSQQAEGLSQINQGLGQIDQVTQQNTAHAEQTAAAAEELAGQSTHLQSLINHFRVSSR